MYASDESPLGCDHMVRIIYRAVRSKAADYISKDNSRSNVDVVTNVYVDKVIPEDTSNGLRAVGVDLQKLHWPERVSMAGMRSRLMGSKVELISLESAKV